MPTRSAPILAVTATLFSSSIACEAERLEAAVEPRPNFQEDVLPIVQERCLRCHLGEGFGGVRLDTYEGALRAVPHLTHVIANREMPPWGVDSSGRCGQWREPQWLRDDELKTLLGWIANGYPNGNPHEGRLSPTTMTPVVDSSETTTHPLMVGGGFRPDASSRGTRCFVVDSMIEHDTYLTGMSFESRAPFAIRQATIYELDSPEAVQRTEQFEAAEPGPGFGCAEGGTTGGHFLFGVTASSPELRLPSGAGVPVHGNAKLVVQLHYSAFAPGAEEGANLLLNLSSSAREGQWREVRASISTLARNRPDAHVESTSVLAEGLNLLAIYPVMRVYGSGLTLTADLPGGGPRCLMRQINWALTMDREPRVLAEGLSLPRSSFLSLSCQYDTRGTDIEIGAGETFDNEECAVRLFGTAESQPR